MHFIYSEARISGKYTIIFLTPSLLQRKLQTPKLQWTYSSWKHECKSSIFKKIGNFRNSKVMCTELLFKLHSTKFGQQMNMKRFLRCFYAYYELFDKKRNKNKKKETQIKHDPFFFRRPNKLENL